MPDARDHEEGRPRSRPFVFGKDENFAGGANGQLTGYFNSALCGNGGGGTAP